MDALKWYPESIDVLDRPVGNYLVRIMGAYEVLRAGRRWLECASAKAKKENTPAANSEISVALSTLSGWAHETVELFNEAKQCKGLVKKPDEPGLVRLWEEFKARRSNRLRLAKTVRNECIFHITKESANHAIQLIKKDPEGYPFFKTPSAPNLRGRQIASQYPWGVMMLTSWAAEDDGSNQKVSKNVEVVVGLVRDLIKLFGELLQQILKAQRLLDNMRCDGASVSNGLGGRS